MRCRIEHTLTFVGDRGHLEENANRLYKALLDADGAHEPTIVVEPGAGRLDVAMTVAEAADPLDAAARATSLLRAALWQAGEGAPGWERLARQAHTSCRVVPLADA